MTRRIVLSLLAILAIAVTVVWGFGGLVVFAFFAGIAAAVTFAAGVGGEWIRDASSRRFDDRHH